MEATTVMLDKSSCALLWIEYSEILPLVTDGADQRIKTEGPAAWSSSGEDCPFGTEKR